MRATSQVSGLVSFGAIGLILLLLTEPIQYLPTAILGAVIVFASLKLIEPQQWRGLAHSSRVEVAISAVTAVVVVAIGVLPAIVVAVVLSIIDVVRRAATPGDAVLGYPRSSGFTGQRYADVDTHPGARVTPGVVVYRIQERLFFANAHFFKRRVWAAVDGAPKPVRHLVLDAAMISGIDASAVEAVREVQAGLHSRNIVLEVARATDELREQFAQTGLTELIGPEPLPRNGRGGGRSASWVRLLRRGPTAIRRTQTGRRRAEAGGSRQRVQWLVWVDRGMDSAPPRLAARPASAQVLAEASARKACRASMTVGKMWALSMSSRVP